MFPDNSKLFKVLWDLCMESANEIAKQIFKKKSSTEN